METKLDCDFYVHFTFDISALVATEFFDKILSDKEMLTKFRKTKNGRQWRSSMLKNTA